MRARLHWIEAPVAGRLAIMARPRAGDWLEDEIAGWRADGIDLVVSLLEPEEIGDLDLRREPALCRTAGMEFVAFPIPDRGVPASRRDTLVLIQALAARIGSGDTVAIHCRAGIGRSSLIAACVLARGGIAADTAFDLITAARGVPVPDTDEQRDWAVKIAER